MKVTLRNPKFKYYKIQNKSKIQNSKRRFCEALLDLGFGIYFGF